MKTRTIHSLLLAIFLFVGCSDTITNNYPTRAQAEADKLFEKGWLPNIIPASAREITISNDLDVNISEGEFHYDPKETNEFLRHLKPYSRQKQKPKLDRWQTYIAKQKKEGYDAFEYITNKTFWIFLVNNGTGHVRYLMWLQSNN